MPVGGIRDDSDVGQVKCKSTASETTGWKLCRLKHGLFPPFGGGLEDLPSGKLT